MEDNLKKLGFKICKYCGSYYSPQGTWHKDHDDWVCIDCFLEHELEKEEPIEIEEESDINWIKKVMLGWRTRLARWTENPKTMVQLHLQAPLARLRHRVKCD